MKPLQGHATPAETAAYLDAHGSMSRNVLGRTGLSVSRAGFGCYRVDIASLAHKDAMTRALSSGVNLIDTSANYVDGRSEMLAGEVVEELAASAAVPRGSFVVVTKGGYLQGVNYEAGRKRRNQGRPYPDLVEYDEGLDHCIHPEFLEEQIGLSLDRLNMATIDAYLLHNPEYYLSWAEKHGISRDEAHREYYSRIEKAFVHLEMEAERGRIKYYGISSNSFPADPAAYNFTSFEKVIEIARKISPDNRFAVIEFPMNLFECGAGIDRNGASLIAAAAGAGIGVLINRPLNAFYEGSMIRLAEPAVVPLSPADLAALGSGIDLAVDALGEAELELKNIFNSNATGDASTARRMAGSLFIAGDLCGGWKGFGTLSNWESFMHGAYGPRADFFMQNIERHVFSDETLSKNMAGYIKSAVAVLGSIGEYFRDRHLSLAAKLREKALPLIMREGSGAAARGASDRFGSAPAVPLSRLAVSALAATPGISSILVGMRSVAYVEDVIAAVSADALPAAPPDWHAIGEAVRSCAPGNDSV